MVALAVGVIIVLVVAAVCAYRWRPTQRLAILTARAVAGGGRAASRGLRAEIFRLVYRAIHRRDYTVAYQGIEYLKTLWGEIPATPADQRQVAGLLITLIRLKWPQLGLHAVDIYRPLVRTLAERGADLTPVAGRLAFAGLLAVREKQPVMAAKVLDALFYLYDKAPPAQQAAVTAGVFRALDGLTRQAVRVRDYDLLREVISRTAAVAESGAYIPWRQAREWVTALMYRAVTDGDVQVAAAASAFLRRWAQKGVAYPKELQTALAEWADIARLALLNPQHTITPLLLEDMLALGRLFTDWRLGQLAIDKSAAIAIWAILRYGVAAARPVLWPLLREGRRMLQWELRFGCGDADSYRQRLLWCILEKCLLLAQTAARQDFTLSPGDFIQDLCRAWLDTEDGRRASKSTRKFCCLWLLYWMQERQRQARKNPPSREWAATKALFTNQELERLTFLHAH